MAESKSKKMPHFESLDDLVEFFDTQDMGDYLDKMPEEHFAVDTIQTWIEEKGRSFIISKRGRYNGKRRETSDIQ